MSLFSLKRVLLIVGVLLLASCALKPISPEFTFIRNESGKVDLGKLGNGKILIYNGADVFHKMDKTGRLNVWINNKALGQIKPSEYVIVNLENRKHLFTALHIDLVKMKSNHEVLVGNETKIIKIKPSVTSNKLTVTNILPNNFDKFKYVESK